MIESADATHGTFVDRPNAPARLSMEPHLMDLAVLIPTHNRLELLERTVNSVLACHRPKNWNVRLIVVENGGRHGAETLVIQKNAGHLEYLYFEPGNKSGALNMALGKVEKALVVFLDDDVRVAPDLLVRYAAAAEGLNAGKFFGGGLLIDYEEEPPSWLLEFLPRSATGWHPTEFSPQGRMYFFGANWAAFSTDLQAAGGFDEKLGPGGTLNATGQETGMQQKLIAAGVEPTYIRDAVVWHYVPMSRSSPEWAIERAYRTAISSALQFSEKDLRLSFRGIPLWLVRQLVSFAGQLLVQQLNRNERKKFHARFKFKQALGSLKGARNRYKSKSRNPKLQGS